MDYYTWLKNICEEYINFEEPPRDINGEIISLEDYICILREEYNYDKRSSMGEIQSDV